MEKWSRLGVRAITPLAPKKWVARILADEFFPEVSSIEARRFLSDGSASEASFK